MIRTPGSILRLPGSACATGLADRRWWLGFGTGGYDSDSGDEFGLPNRGRDDVRTNWTLGGGFEYALPTTSFLNFVRASAMTFEVEGPYARLNHNRACIVVGFNSATGSSLSVGDPNVQIVRVLANRRSDASALVGAGVNDIVISKITYGKG